MALKYEAKTYRVEFEEGHPLHGLHMRFKGMKVSDFLSTVRMATQAQTAVESGELSTDMIALAAEATEQLNQGFAKSLLEWDLTDENDVPIPTTPEAIGELDQDFVSQLIQEWMQVIGGTSPALGKGSGSGATSPVPPIQMPPTVAL